MKQFDKAAAAACFFLILIVATAIFFDGIWRPLLIVIEFLLAVDIVIVWHRKHVKKQE